MAGVSSVFLGEHGCEGRQVLVDGRVHDRREVVAHVSGQSDEHTVGEELRRESRKVTDEGLFSSQYKCQGLTNVFRCQEKVLKAFMCTHCCRSVSAVCAPRLRYLRLAYCQIRTQTSFLLLGSRSSVYRKTERFLAPSSGSSMLRQ